MTLKFFVAIPLFVAANFFWETNSINNLISTFPSILSESFIDEPLDSSSLIIKKYVDAIGGKENLLKVKDRTSVFVGSIQETACKITMYQKNPDKFLQIVSVDSVEQKIFFNGTRGFQSSLMGIKELNADLLNNLRIDAVFNFVLNYPEYGIRAIFAGVEKFNGKNAFKIEFQCSDSIKFYEYFDSETGLKIRQEKTIITNGDKIKLVSDFDDYRTIEGVKYPFRIRQAFGSQLIVIEVISIKINQDLNDMIFEPGN